jgi:hypothetical protein
MYPPELARLNASIGTGVPYKLPTTLVASEAYNRAQADLMESVRRATESFVSNPGLNTTLARIQEMASKNLAVSPELTATLARVQEMASKNLISPEMTATLARIQEMASRNLVDPETLRKFADAQLSIAHSVAMAGTRPSPRSPKPVSRPGTTAIDNAVKADETSDPAPATKAPAKKGAKKSPAKKASSKAH